MKMADVFSQIYIQTVFAVRNRQALILPSWENELYKYTTGIVENRGHKMLSINGMPDHIHIFFGMKPSEAISDLVREIKKATNDFIKDNHFTPRDFEWQSGYGGFSYHRSQIDRVCKYIMNQKAHHAKRSFEQEFQEILKEYGIEIGRKKMFDFFHPD